MTSSRIVARDVLVRVDDGAYANLALRDALRHTELSGRDRAFVTELVGGALRRRRRVDALLDRHGRRPLADLDPAARAALRLGAYQLLVGIPAHAAVGESVAVVPRRARGYVNGVLRALAASGPPWPEPHSVGEALSYPDWIVDLLTTDLGVDEARAALEAQNEAPGLTLRPNRRRTDADALAAELLAGGGAVACSRLVHDAVAVRGVGDPGLLPAIVEGRATPQDAASQAVVDLVDARPGARVLDVAAAPGGKATGLAERVGDDGLIVALDPHAARLALVTAAARRLQLANVHPVLADGRRPPIAAGTMDRVLVDAPCSGLAVLRRRADARWRAVEPSQELLDLQVALIVAAVATLRPGGRLVYSVCTLTTAETSGAATAALTMLGDTVRVVTPPPTPWRPWGAGALLVPQAASTDGMFVLVLERTMTERRGPGR